MSLNDLASQGYYSDENVFIVENSFGDNSTVTATTVRPERNFYAEKTSDGRSVAKLKCQVKRDDIKVKWLKDEVVLEPSMDSDKYKLIENGQERMLIVNDVRADDEGEYICQHGKYRVTLYLTINEASNEIMPTQSAMASEDEEGHSGLFFHDDLKRIARRFRSEIKQQIPRRSFTSIKDMYVHEGIRNAELKCKVRNEQMEVQWFKEDRLLANSDKYTILSKGYDRILVIKNPTKADNGNYTCHSGAHKVVLYLNVDLIGQDIPAVAYSSSDEDSIFMKSKKTLSNTTSTNTIMGGTYQFEQSELTYYHAQNADLRCHVKRDNEPVIWLKDNNRLWGSNQDLNKINDKYEAIQDGFARTLIIKNLSDQDSGNYSCLSAHNPKSRVEFRMNIKGKSSLTLLLTR